jgi:hypothetical protein
MHSNLSLSTTNFKNISTSHSYLQDHTVLIYASSNSNINISTVAIESVILGYIVYLENANLVNLDGLISDNSFSSLIFCTENCTLFLGTASSAGKALNVSDNRNGVFATLGGFPEIKFGFSVFISPSNLWKNNRLLVFENTVDNSSAVSVLNSFKDYSNVNGTIWINSGLARYLNQTSNNASTNAYIRSSAVSEAVIMNEFGGRAFYASPLSTNSNSVNFASDLMLVTVSY